MNRLEKIYELTLELKKLFDQKIQTRNREEVIVRLNELLEIRGEYMKQLTPPYTEEETKLGQQLIPMNEQIEKQIQKLFHDLKKEMRQFKKQKKSNQSYLNPYEQVQTNDGMFLDKKK